jgi:hypothetical protein
MDKIGQRPSEVLYVVVKTRGEAIEAHTYHDGDNLLEALGTEGMLFIGAIGFTKTLVGSKLIDRATTMACCPEEHAQQVTSILYYAAKEWMRTPSGSLPRCTVGTIDFSEGCQVGLQRLDRKPLRCEVKPSEVIQ